MTSLLAFVSVVVAFCIASILIWVMATFGGMLLDLVDRL